jgi:hypothetical protein
VVLLSIRHDLLQDLLANWQIDPLIFRVFLKFLQAYPFLVARDVIDFIARAEETSFV